MAKNKRADRFSKVASIIAGIVILGAFSAGFTMEIYEKFIVPVIDDLKANSPSISIGDMVTKNGDIISSKDLGIKITGAHCITSSGEKIAMYAPDSAKTPTSGGEVGRVSGIDISINKKTNTITEVIINNSIAIIQPLTFTDEKTGKDSIALSYEFIDVEFTDAIIQCKITDGNPYDKNVVQYITTVGKLDPYGECKRVDLGEYNAFPDSFDPLNTYISFPAKQTEKGFVVPICGEYTMDDLAEYGYLTWTTVTSFKEKNEKANGKIILPDDFLPAIVFKIPNDKVKTPISETEKPSDEEQGVTGGLSENEKSFQWGRR